MQYILLFLEGIITFISPCLLPLLPMYVSYFAADEADKRTALTNSLGFVLGFTLVFLVMGSLAGSVGALLRDYSTLLNILTGLLVIGLGLHFLGLLRLGLLRPGSFRPSFSNRVATPRAEARRLRFLPSVLFGVIFSITWTPCVGAFLGSALLMASLGDSPWQGLTMLLAFSLGLGIPFVASALAIDRLKNAFDFIKRNYRVINLASGGLLIVFGILMATGYMGLFLSLLAF